MKERLTKHFRLSELVKTEVRALQELNRKQAEQHLPALQALAKLLEEVRDLLGDRPIVVHSGYRCPELNSRIGGSPSSQHLKGEAADFHVVGMDLRDAFDLIRRSSIPYGQVILEDGDGDGEPSWIHLSLGPPWRTEARSRQALIFDGRRYESVS